jgi:16S rRNA (guanine527-N7)-methyltransferase
MAVELEPEPAVAAAIFPTGMEQVRTFARNLAEQGEKRGLIGPREPGRLWSRHILNSGVLAEVLRPGHVIDVGSGGGLPGIVVAIARPDVQFTLIEPMERRTAWLDEQVRELGLVNVTVCRARAQEAPFGETGDQVTARAVSALRTLIPLVVPLVKPGGELILMKGENAPQELKDAHKQIARYGLTDVRVVTLGADVLEQPTWIVRATVE